MNLWSQTEIMLHWITDFLLSLLVFKSRDLVTNETEYLYLIWTSIYIFVVCYINEVHHISSTLILLSGGDVIGYHFILQCRINISRTYLLSLAAFENVIFY